MPTFKKLVFFYLAFLLLAWLFLPFVAHAASFSDTIIGPACTINNLISCYVEKIIRLFIAVASISSIFMIIFGGILLITSAGDPKKVTTGRMAVTGAIIGLVIVLLSYSIQLFIEKIVTEETPGSTSGINTGADIITLPSSTLTIPPGGSLPDITTSTEWPNPGEIITISDSLYNCQGILSEFRKMYFSKPEPADYTLKSINVLSQSIEVSYTQTLGSLWFTDLWSTTGNHGYRLSNQSYTGTAQTNLIDTCNLQ